MILYSFLPSFFLNSYHLIVASLWLGALHTPAVNAASLITPGHLLLVQSARVAKTLLSPAIVAGNAPTLSDLTPGPTSRRLIKANSLIGPGLKFGQVRLHGIGTPSHLTPGPLLECPKDLQRGAHWTRAQDPRSIATCPRLNKVRFTMDQGSSLVKQSVSRLSLWV